MRRFEYRDPLTLDEAVDLLRDHNGRAAIMAGGTDLLVEIKGKTRQPDCLIDIKKIPGLAFLIYDENDGLRIGALTTVRSIETSPVVNRLYAGLAQAARELGSLQIRNRATLVGNICRASPSADLPPPLIADGAVVRLHGPDGERVLPLGGFFTGPGQTVLAQDELAVEVLVPNPPPHTGKVYVKHGRRKAMELASVGVAVALTLEGDICKRIRVVLGAVAPTPIRVPAAEEILRDTVIEENAIEAAARTAAEASHPISDVRSSASYRREMVQVLTGRALREALARARAG
ncbi:FAD binding domain-containing protein [Chloroflexota bacterium]